MSYLNPLWQTFQFQSYDFGGTAAGSVVVQAPPGMTVGRLVDLGVNPVTEIFAGSTTNAKIRVGDGTDADRYAELNITNGTDVGDAFNVRNDTDAIIEPTILVSDLTNAEVVVSYVDATGTPTGIAVPFITIAWS